MYLNVEYDNKNAKRYHISKENFFDETLRGQVGYIGTQSKEANALNLLKAYFSDAKAILLDETNKAILTKLTDLSVSEFMSTNKNKTIFDQEEFNLMYFT
ncbi:MAG: hypothetical protein L0Y61_04475, partial [Epsilonproteobacteria bacterium]|nr:hypothetical protein [Campylobacterota bacterium]